MQGSEAMTFEDYMFGVLLLVLAAGVGAAIALVFSEVRKRKAWKAWQDEMLKKLGAYSRTYQKKEITVEGETVNFLTVDGGKNWYIFETADDGGVKIILEHKKIPQPVLTDALIQQLAIERMVWSGGCALFG
ncbi:MAG: hypothetical protein A3E92_03160 [Candidatus Taylorbacteria bacterium RIFCSPHIGHO2_12_FULL_42_34]|nr:MAG: hypothetical protein A3E92_03160 [Candidatus Taylorbacteria bacterium RIFCSPHIGHO2_12_FULL_42_34]